MKLLLQCVIFGAVLTVCSVGVLLGAIWVVHQGEPYTAIASGTALFLFFSFMYYVLYIDIYGFDD